MLLRLFTLLLTACCVAAQDAPLTTARELLALESAADGPKPAVRLRGVVTYFKGAGFPDLVVQDATGGVFVSGAEGKVPAGLRTGAVVEIEGVCNARGNSFTPRVEMESARIVGAAALPAPVPAGMGELRSGRLDCQRIEMHGIVRAARLDEALVPPRLILKIATPSGECDAWVLAFSPGDGERLVDAAVRVRGVCLGWENPRRQLTNIRLLVGSMEDLAIERAAPPDAFAAPLVAPDALLRYRPDATPAEICAALDAGDSGYLLKTAGPQELFTAIVTIAGGGMFVPDTLRRLASESAAATPLSARQREMLDLLVKGLSNKEIASVLGFTEDGAKSHLKSIFAKLGVQSRAEAVAVAIQNGIVPGA